MAEANKLVHLNNGGVHLIYVHKRVIKLTTGVHPIKHYYSSLTQPANKLARLFTAKAFQPSLILRVRPGAYLGWGVQVACSINFVMIVNYKL
jgi:hypothetical protein